MGFLRGSSSPAPIPKIETPVSTVAKKVAETVQPGDEGKKSKKKGRGGTILTSVTGVTNPAELGKPTLLGGMY
tara:strand:+ start:99 stop:317 length:219 start_codon:yes stop_codon:yes gene_type:complete